MDTRDDTNGYLGARCGGGLWGGGGSRGRWEGGGYDSVIHLVPEGGAAVAESQDALPALGDVEGAAHAGVGHADLPEAVLTAALRQLLLVVTLWREAGGSHHG